MEKFINFTVMIIFIWCIVSITLNLKDLNKKADTLILMGDTATKSFYQFARDYNLVKAIENRNNELVRKSIPLRKLAKRLADEQARLGEIND